MLPTERPVTFKDTVKFCVTGVTFCQWEKLLVNFGKYAGFLNSQFLLVMERGILFDELSYKVQIKLGIDFTFIGKSFCVEVVNYEGVSKWALVKSPILSTSDMA